MASARYQLSDEAPCALPGAFGSPMRSHKQAVVYAQPQASGRVIVQADRLQYDVSRDKHLLYNMTQWCMRSHKQAGVLSCGQVAS
eukprot:scaffold140307_cov19-Tisochrysis_lutea.AAC.1